MWGEDEIEKLVSTIEKWKEKRKCIKETKRGQASKETDLPQHPEIEASNKKRKKRNVCMLKVMKSLTLSFPSNIFFLLTFYTDLIYGHFYSNMIYLDNQEKKQQK